MFVTPYIKAGYSCLYIRSTEQERVMDEINRDLKEADLSGSLTIYTWKSTMGLTPWLSDNPASDQVAYDLVESLKYIQNGTNGDTPENKLYVIFNPKKFLTENPIAIQALRDAAYAIRLAGSHIIMVGAGIDIPEEISEVVTFVDFELPTKEELKKTFKAITDQYSNLIEGEVTDDILEVAADNALGLSALKAENAISLSIVEAGGVDVAVLRKEKQLAIKQSGVLEYIEHKETMDTLGGFDILKAHVLKRRKYFHEHKKATAYGLTPPKGIMLVGVAGCGKSLASKAISAALELPLYRFNLGSVFGSLVGQSEQRIREATKLMEAIAPAVILIDEVEKLLAGLESSGKSDSGTTSRVVATLLSWMNDTTSSVYKVATANTIRNLDAALFRSGRWDAIFGIDVPNSQEREQIFSIHLKKRQRDPDKFDLSRLSALSESYVGAEIENAISSALFTSFDLGRELTMDDLEASISTIIPISTTSKEDITNFRQWIKSRALPASSPLPELKISSSKGTRSIRGN